MKTLFCSLALAVLCLNGCGGAATPDDTSEHVQTSSSSSSSGGTSSSSGGPIKPDEQILAAVEIQRDLWQSYGILEYEVTLKARYGNALPIDVVLHVNEGELISVTQRDAENPVDASNQFGILTIEEAFEAVESAASTGAYQLSVQYDTTYGFPSRFYRDYRSDWHDDQDEWTFSEFTVLR